MTSLPSVKKGIRRHNLDNELLVYDPADEQIHLLNPSAAKVLDMMMNGSDSAKIIGELEVDAPKGSGADLLELALGELSAARLFDDAEAMKSHASMQPTTRRQMIMRAASIGAAVAVPSILTLAPNKALAQAGSALPNGQACTHSTQCLSGCCGGNAVGSCLNNRCNPPANCTTCTP
jgi:hypothetical protein